jgi:hypothetical protein
MPEHIPATPKQVAFLRFMGFKNSDQLSKDKAHSVIDNLLEVDDPDEADRRQEKIYEWGRVKFLQHPDLYAAELDQYLKRELIDDLHRDIRKRVVGASERLTKGKIKTVCDILGAEDADWWKQDACKDSFYLKLIEFYPGCCDGKPPIVQPRTHPEIEARKAPIPQKLPSRSPKFIIHKQQNHLPNTDPYVTASPPKKRGGLVLVVSAICLVLSGFISSMNHANKISIMANTLKVSSAPSVGGFILSSVALLLAIGGLTKGRTFLGLLLILLSIVGLAMAIKG